MSLLSWIRVIDVHQNAVFEMEKNRWRARVTDTAVILLKESHFVREVLFINMYENKIRIARPRASSAVILHAVKLCGVSLGWEKLYASV